MSKTLVDTRGWRYGFRNINHVLTRLSSTRLWVVSSFAWKRWIQMVEFLWLQGWMAWVIDDICWTTWWGRFGHTRNKHREGSTWVWCGSGWRWIHQDLTFRLLLLFSPHLELIPTKLMGGIDAVNISVVTPVIFHKQYSSISSSCAVHKNDLDILHPNRLVTRVGETIWGQFLKSYVSMAYVSMLLLQCTSCPPALPCHCRVKTVFIHLPSNTSNPTFLILAVLHSSNTEWTVCQVSHEPFRSNESASGQRLHRGLFLDSTLVQAATELVRELVCL